MDLTDVFRTTGTGNGIGTSFGGIPFNNNFPTAGLTENRMSMQNSRLSLRVDSDVAGGHAVGYLEVDFLGADCAKCQRYQQLELAPFARLLFGLPAADRGNSWADRTGLCLLRTVKACRPFPSDIFYGQEMDTNYQVGLTWARQAQLRLAYHPNDNWAFARFAGKLGSTRFHAR